MKTEGHPELHATHVVCACGEEWNTLSTSAEIRVEICSKCHPFFTGKQRFVDTAGRVEKFQQKMATSRKRKVS